MTPWIASSGNMSEEVGERLSEPEMAEDYIEILFYRHNRATVHVNPSIYDSIHKTCTGQSQTKSPHGAATGFKLPLLAEELLTTDSC